MEAPTLNDMSDAGKAALIFLLMEADPIIRDGNLNQADKEHIRAWMNLRREELRDKK
jgi:hypothetical protein